MIYCAIIAFFLCFVFIFYISRHSWATNAKYQGIPIEMISESLGHKSIKTTQTYLKGFGLKKRTEANQLNCFYVESYNTSHQ